MPMSAAPRVNESPLRSRRPAAVGWARGASVRRRLGAKADLNLHAYVGADPVNWTDPAGLARNEIVITAPPRPQNPPEPLRTGSWGSFGSIGSPSEGGGRNPARACAGSNCVEVTATNPDSQPSLPPIILAAAEANGPEGADSCPAGLYRLAGKDIFSRYGITGTPLGLAPYDLQGKTLLSTIYGDNKVAVTYFIFLHKAVDDWLIFPNPAVKAGLISVPSRISYRIGDRGLARIDIPANTFTLDRPESIHVSAQCPTRR